MGLKDLMWDTSPVGRITKHVAKNFQASSDIHHVNNQFRLFMKELGYYTSSDQTFEMYLDRIKGNPLFFMYFLMCIEFKKMPSNLDNQTNSIVKYMCKRFDKHNASSHHDYVSGVTYKDYDGLATDCKLLLSSLVYGW